MSDDRHITEDGEIIEAPEAEKPSPVAGPGLRRGRPRKKVTEVEAAELVERRRVLDERAEVHARYVASIESIAPAIRMPDDPPLRGDGRMPLNSRTSQGVVLGEAIRDNGTIVRCVRRDYDGMNGGTPRARYVGVYTIFRSNGAVRGRSRGSALVSKAEAMMVRDALNVALPDWPEDLPASEGNE